MATHAYSSWENHVIVCGLEGVGLRTVEQLHRSGIPVVVIDHQPDLRILHLARELDVPHLTGNARLPATLHEAGIEGARAILCLQDRDLDVLETVLVAHEIAPELRIVTRVTNPAVASALITVTGEDGMLDFAQLVSPAIVDCCLGHSSNEFTLADRSFAIATTSAERTGSLRDLYGDLSPVAVVPIAERSEHGLVICPGRDKIIQAGDLVTMVGTPEELQQVGITVDAENAQRVRERRRLLRHLRLLRRAFHNAVNDTGRGLFIVLGALGLVSVASAVVLMNFYVEPNGQHLGLIAAIYFTAETIATVGFGDFSFSHQGSGLELFGVSLIVCGATLVTALFALLTNLLVSRRIAQAFGRYRVPGMHGHVVVVGLGSVGIRVVELLVEQGVEVVIIEADEDNRYLDLARNLGVPVVAADGTSPAVLRSVNIERARGVAVLTSDDLTNIETGLGARECLAERFDEVPVAIRLFDHVLARTVARHFGFGNVRSTSVLAAPWFVGAALGLAVHATFSVEQKAFFIGSLEISAEGGLHGVAMSELSAKTRVIALRRTDGTLEYPPRRLTTFQAGDEAFLIGPAEELINVLLREEQFVTPLWGLQAEAS